MTRSCGVGVVGLSAEGGWAAATHVPALGLADGIELRAVVASSPASSARSAAAFGARGHPDVASLTRDPEVDLVVVAVKTPDHEAAVLTALDAGTPVLCEWPFTGSARRAAELAAYAEARHVPLFAGLQGRSSPVLRQVRDLVAGGAVGTPVLTTVDALGIMGGAVVAERGRYQLDPTQGATLLTIAVGHLLDDLQLVLGPLREVTGMATVGHREVEVRETGERLPSLSPSHVVLTARAGERGLVALACHGGGDGRPGLVWRVHGTEGELTIEGDVGHPQMAELTVWRTVGAGEREMVIGPGSVRHAVECLGAAYENVRDALAGLPSSAPTAAEAGALLEVLETAVS